MRLRVCWVIFRQNEQCGNIDILETIIAANFLVEIVQMRVSQDGAAENCIKFYWGCAPCDLFYFITDYCSRLGYSSSLRGLCGCRLSSSGNSSSTTRRWSAEAGKAVGRLCSDRSGSSKRPILSRSLSFLLFWKATSLIGERP